MIHQNRRSSTWHLDPGNNESLIESTEYRPYQKSIPIHYSQHDDQHWTGYVAMLLSTGVLTFRRRRISFILLCLTLFIFIVFGLKLQFLFSSNHSALTDEQPHRPFTHHQRSDVFRSFQVNGFTASPSSHNDSLSNTSCSSLSHASTIQVQDSIFLEDDLFEIAKSLDGHPMVDYPRYGIIGGSTTLSRLVEESWDRLATSCTFMNDYRVHLCVSRIIFHPGRAKDHPRISFLRGQIFSESWEHLHGYKLRWKGKQDITFPRMFDVDIEYQKGQLFFGPEDPRIIIEDVPGAEPVIVFNMMSSQSQWRRAMWMFRPFTQQLTLLNINGVERLRTEKNWSPLFLQDPSKHNQPSTHLHFVWHLTPLTVLKCHLESGLCDIVFEQTTPQLSKRGYLDREVSLRGGTQFIPIPRSKSMNSASSENTLQGFLSLPRHHISTVCGCKSPAYRPEFATLMTNTTHFYLNYLSGPLDFGPNAVLPAKTYQDACGEGRIMIANSIAQWDLNSDLVQENTTTDVLTLALSVDDATSQVMRVAGLYDALSEIPSFSGYFLEPPVQNESHSSPSKPDITIADTFQDLETFEKASTTAWIARNCVEEAALNYTTYHGKNKTGFRHWIDIHADRIGVCLP